VTLALTFALLCRGRGCKKRIQSEVYPSSVSSKGDRTSGKYSHIKELNAF